MAATSPSGHGTRELDLRGLMCPLPALKVRKALKTMRPGEDLAVTCTDPMSAIDIPHLLSQTGDVLRESSVEAGEYRFLLEKA